MSFRLDAKEGASEGVRRIIVERTDEALELLQAGDGTSSDEVVHTARKRFKEVRAALRLVRDELGEDVFEKENHAFRDAGRPLSEVRDAHVLVEALDGLVKGDDAGGIGPATVAPLRKLLLERRRDVRRLVLEGDKALDKVAAAIKAARGRVKDWPLRRGGWKAIGPGLGRTYRDGRDALDAALGGGGWRGGGDDERFHEWRKRVKDLRYQLEILRPLWSDVMEEWADQAHALADHLGDDHDLVVLRQVVGDHPGTVKAPKAFMEKLQDRQDKLRGKAEALGRRLYGEKPAAFLRRVERYWDVFRKD